MSKENITAGNLLPWDHYAKLEKEVALARMYVHAGETSQTSRQWYWKSIKTKRWTSLWIRVLSFLLLAAGTILPVIAATRGEPADRLDLTQWGVGALAAAGLLQLADRAFGWSSGWMRYIATVTAMESCTHQFELKWAGIILEKGGALAVDDVKAFFSMAKEMEEQILKLQEDETGKWIAEFNAGISLLESSVKSLRETQEKTLEAARTMEEARTKARQPGAIELTLKFKTAPGPVRIALDGASPQPFTGTMWARTGISPGHHVIRIEKDATPPFVLEKIADVQAGAVYRGEVELP